MDRATRLIQAFCLIAVLIGWRPALAVDEIAPQSTKVFSCTAGDGSMKSGTSAVSVAQGCQAPRQTYSWGYAENIVKTCDASGNPAACLVDNIVNGEVVQTYPFSLHWNIQLDCPENSTSYSGANGVKSCACNSMFRGVGGNRCEQYTCPPSGSYSAITQPDQKVPVAGATMCSGGCGYQPSSWKVGQDGQIWAAWPFKSTGSFCNGDKKAGTPVDTGEANSKNPAPVPCGQNQCPGTVNGATICVPCKGTQEQGPSTTASAPGTGASAATVTDSTTECNGVNCTTTTTTRDGYGNVTGQTQTSEKQESFCKENPQSALCKQSSFGGACAATTCEGDAVMCAIAADQFKRNCEWFEDQAAAQLATVGNAALTGQDRPPGHPANDASAQSVSFASVIDQTDRLGSGCPTDVAVSVAGKSVSIPFSSMCGNLQLVGNLMVGFCMFVAALIVFRN